jgi:CheY-like chemotaxis protein
LLAYGRRQVLMPEDLDINAVIATMADMLRRLIGENVELALDLEPGLGAKVDRSCLEQVIMNLSINARDAVGSGGRLALSTRTIELDAAFCATRELAPGRYVKLVASDDGHGMDEATSARVFEPFFTTKAFGKGPARLSTVYGIVKQSAGHLESAVRVARLAIHRHLPAVSCRRQLSVDAGVAATRPTRARARRRRQCGVRTLIRRHLSRQATTSCGVKQRQAFTLAVAQPIDLLVTDLVMPTMGGSSPKLRITMPDLRILYMSGYPDEEVPSGKNSSFLRKPFTRQELLTRVDLLLDPSRDRASSNGLKGMLDEVE